MSIIKKFPIKKKTSSGAITAEQSSGKVVNIDKKINDTIQQRLSGYVKEIQTFKTKQKKLAAKQKALGELGGSQLKKKKKEQKPTKNKPKK